MIGQKRPTAIDLYSGVGGWALGLRLAGIDVIASYERWAPANETNFKNNKHPSHTVDIRKIEESDLPHGVDFVVGSPPCTQFSLSNRGGAGDIEDGLTDIEKFLSIVEYIRPRFWVMENVPRFKPFLEAALKEGGRLERFSHLKPSFEIFNMEEFGLPQRRRRCLVGNFNFQILKSYTKNIHKCTLGNIVEALKSESVCDPLFGVCVPQKSLFDHDVEPHLNEEETRINLCNKKHHPIYNAMSFPDPLDRSVRTITATCTRVSRESVIIEDPDRSGKFRRLTVRERACLQGFPISFQFYGQSYASKIKMIGNAVPPVFSYYIANALQAVSASCVLDLKSHADKLRPPSKMPKKTRPDRAGKIYPWDRTFRFAIPHLQLKSGVRFELANFFEGNHAGWQVRFVFGTSKDIYMLPLDHAILIQLVTTLPSRSDSSALLELNSLSEFLMSVDVTRMQDVWSHRGPGGTRPFTLLDRLGEAALALRPAILEEDSSQIKSAINAALEIQMGIKVTEVAGHTKLMRNAPLIYSGILIGSLVNATFAPNEDKKPLRLAI
jgi:DNA (cytosine-5)-methyltransferase 1